MSVGIVWILRALHSDLVKLRFKSETLNWCSIVVLELNATAKLTAIIIPDNPQEHALLWIGSWRTGRKDHAVHCVRGT